MGIFYILGIFTIFFLLFALTKYYKSVALFSLFPIFVSLILLRFTHCDTAYQVSIKRDYDFYQAIDCNILTPANKLKYYNRIDEINQMIIRHNYLKENWFFSCLAKPDIYNLSLIILDI